MLILWDYTITGWRLLCSHLSLGCRDKVGCEQRCYPPFNLLGVQIPLYAFEGYYDLSGLRSQPHSSKHPVTLHRMETSPDKRHLPLSHLDLLIDSARLCRKWDRKLKSTVSKSPLESDCPSGSDVDLKAIKQRLMVVFGHFLIYQVLSSAFKVQFLVPTLGLQHRASLIMFYQDELLS